jgi:hypothetical protein
LIILEAAISELGGELQPEGSAAEPRDEMRDIVVAALGVAAETFADDPAARLRRSRREDELRGCIIRHTMSHEERSRESND